mgnify:CR=1 FL=1
MEIIINYFVEAIKALLSIFGKEFDAEVEDNLRSMFGGMFGYKPEVDAE